MIIFHRLICTSTYDDVSIYPMLFVFSVYCNIPIEINGRWLNTGICDSTN